MCGRKLPPADVPLLTKRARPTLPRFPLYYWQQDEPSSRGQLVKAQSLVDGGLFDYEGKTRNLDDIDFVLKELSTVKDKMFSTEFQSDYFKYFSPKQVGLADKIRAELLFAHTQV
jgi:hypothetical protein